MSNFRVIHGDAAERLREMPGSSVNCCVTSPPYFGLRDYGSIGQIGQESTPDEYAERLVLVFREVRRVLKDDGTLWLNLGDSYNSGSSGGLGGSTISGGQLNQSKSNRHGRGYLPGLKPKDLIGIPWLVAFALRADGWYLRSEVIWHKLNPMPESVTDRPSKAHEQIFLLAKSEKYYYDTNAIREPFADDRAGGSGTLSLRYSELSGRNGDSGLGPAPPHAGRNKRSIWSVASEPYGGAHFATFPTALIDPCILAGCPEGGTVLDPFNGAGTTGVVSLRRGRNYIGIELNPEYATMARNRILDDSPMFNTEAA